MNFACDKCQKVYSIADEKVAGRAFKVTCKQCGHVIQVKASAPRAAAAAPVAAPPPAPRVAPPPTAPPTAAPVAPPRAAPPSAAPAAPAPPRRAAPPPAAAARAAPPAAPPAPPARAAAPPPRPPPRPLAAPSASTPPAAPVLPAVDVAPAPVQPGLEHQTLETTEHFNLFYAAQPTHRPRVTAEWMLQSKKKHPLLFVVAAAAGGLVVAGVVALSIWQVQRPRSGPAEASEKSRYQPAPAAAPQSVVMPAETVKGAAPAPTPTPLPVDLPPEQPLAQRGAAAPRGVGGQAGFESVGGGAGGSDVREKLRQRNLTIAKKDKKLLDLLDKKADSAPTRAGSVERSELDSGGAALDAAAVRQTMAASASAYSACVTRAVKESPNLRVDGKRATLMLTIKPSGVVQSAWIAEADLDKSPLGKCLVSTARRMVFPAFSGDPIDVSVPLALSTQL